MTCGYLSPANSDIKTALISPCELLFRTLEKTVEKNSYDVDMLMDHLELDRELTKTKEKKHFRSSKLWKEVNHILDLVLQPFY